MQKVVGSSPIIRSPESPRRTGGRALFPPLGLALKAYARPFLAGKWAPPLREPFRGGTVDRELTTAPNSFEPQVVPGSKESTATSMRPDRVDVAVVGAGQAGLAVGHFLARQGRRFVILEAADAVGTAWRNRWDSLVLFTPRRYDALPGLRFPGDPDGYPTRDEVIAYLEQYRAAFDLPIEFNSAVRSLTTADDTFRIELDDRQVVADQVVVATGPFHEPRIPEVAAQLAPEVFQLHSSGYRRPGDVPEGRVLVVGGGNSGFQIAKELSASHAVELAVGSRQTPLPQRVLGRDLFWWLTKLGVLTKTVDSRIGRRARDRDTLIGSSPRELKRRHGVTLRPRAVRASGRTVTFADGSETGVQRRDLGHRVSTRPLLDPHPGA